MESIALGPFPHSHSFLVLGLYGLPPLELRPYPKSRKNNDFCFVLFVFSVVPEARKGVGLYIPLWGRETDGRITPESSTPFILAEGLARPRLFTNVLFTNPGSETLNKQPKATQRARKAAELGARRLVSLDVTACSRQAGTGTDSSGAGLALA